jgi:hypothetical protein
VYLNGKLIEDVRDYLSQHANGDVWFFGEDDDNYEEGVLENHDGAWIAGVDGAKPGIWMVANPQVGDQFRNVYYKGKSEDVTRILAVNATVSVPTGTYTDCVETFDWSPIDSPIGKKYYCKEVGGNTLEIELSSPDKELEQKVKLLEVDLRGALGISLPASYIKEGVDMGKVSPPKEIKKDVGETRVEGMKGGKYKDSEKNDLVDSGSKDYATWMFVIVGAIGLFVGVFFHKILSNRSRV